ncbi:MAG: FtsX-like permease family protein [Microbacterium sp.]
MRQATCLAGWLLPGLLRRYRALVLVAVAGIAIVGSIVPLASNTAASAATAKEGLGSPALSAVMLSASGGTNAPEKPLNGASLEEIASVEGVDSAVGWSQALLTVQHGSAVIFPNLTPRFPPLQPALIAGREPVKAGELVLSAALVDELGIDLGDTTVATYNTYVSAGVQEGVDVEVTIVGEYDATTTGIDGDLAAYGDPAWVNVVLAAQQGVPPGEQAVKGVSFQYVYVIAKSRDNVSAVVEQLRALGYTASSLSALLSGVEPVQAVLDLLRVIMASLLVILLLVVAGTAASSLLVSKRGEIGLLRAFGWPRRHVLLAFILQFGALGAVIGGMGAALGAGGLAILSLLFPDGIFGLPVEVGLSPTSIGVLAVFLVAPPLLFALSAALPALRAASTPPDEVLRDLR